VFIFYLIIFSNKLVYYVASDDKVVVVVNRKKVKVKQSHYRPGQAQTVLRKLRFPDFVTTAQDGGKVVSLMHRPSLPPGNTPGTHFC
jgi:hypothetical protein